MPGASTLSSKHESKTEATNQDQYENTQKYDDYERAGSWFRARRQRDHLPHDQRQAHREEANGHESRIRRVAHLTRGLQRQSFHRGVRWEESHRVGRRNLYRSWNGWRLDQSR